MHGSQAGAGVVTGLLVVAFWLVVATATAATVAATIRQREIHGH